MVGADHELCGDRILTARKRFAGTLAHTSPGGKSLTTTAPMPTSASRLHSSDRQMLFMRPLPASGCPGVRKGVAFRRGGSHSNGRRRPGPSWARSVHPSAAVVDSVAEVVGQRVD